MKPTSEGLSCHANVPVKGQSCTYNANIGVVAGAESTSLDEGTVTRLMDVLSDTDVPWMRLAEKLGMKTLTQLYVDSKAPCLHLLQHYKVSSGTPPPLIT